MSKRNINEVMETATDIGQGWTNKEIAMFHCFNPNGLCAKKRKVDEAIDSAVINGKMKSGAILAYGGHNSFGVDMLREIAMKRRVDSSALNYSLYWITDAIVKANEALKREAA